MHSSKFNPNKFIIVVLILISVFAVLAVPAAAHADHTDGCPLMNDHLEPDVIPEPWDYDDRLPDEAGSYYLTQDVTLSSTWLVPHGTVNLCLNGHVIMHDYDVTGSVIRLEDDFGNGFQVLRLFDCCTDRVHYFDKDPALGYWKWKGDEGSVSPTEYSVTGGVITGGYANGPKAGHYDRGGAIYVGEGHELYLYDINLVGNRAKEGGGAVYCCGGSFDMYDGDIIGNNGGEDGSGLVKGAVCMDNGEFTIHNGNITLNDGCCGVYLHNDLCVFEMYDGEISNHTADSGVYMEGGHFTMHDGKIKYNVGGKKYGGTDGDNGGVFVNKGTFTMYGGEISYNRRDGVVVKGGTFNMYENATITRNGPHSDLLKRGCGVSLSGTGVINMYGGEISNHSAGRGAGLYIGSGTFNLYNGSIRNNHGGGEGGGVYLAGGAFNMAGGAIEKNTLASDKNGGGVFVNAGKFTMTGGVIRDHEIGSGKSGAGVCVGGTGVFDLRGGTIRNNGRSGNNPSGGGGVYVMGEGVFNMYKGTITGNGAKWGGGGVAVNSGTAIFNLYGGNITDNNDGGISIDDGVFRLSSTPGEVINVTGNKQSGHDADVWLDISKYMYIDITGEHGATSIIGEMGVRFNGDIVSPNTLTFAKSDDPARDYRYFESDYTGQTWYVDYDTEEPGKEREIFFTLTPPAHSTYTVRIPDVINLDPYSGDGLKGSADVEVTDLNLLSTDKLHVTVESKNNYNMNLVGNEAYKMGYSMTIGPNEYYPGDTGRKNVLEVFHGEMPPISQTLSFAVAQAELDGETFAGEYKDTLTFRVNLETIT